MKHIQTTFAHGNGPFSRVVDLVISYNNLRESNKLERLPAVFPLVPSYAFKGKEPGSKQIQFMKETIEEAAGNGFIEKHPYEFLLDLKQGELLDKVLFKGSNYEEALTDLINNYENNRKDFLKLLEDSQREVKTLKGEIVTIDPKDTELALEFNNRINTENPNSFYINGGAGYFVEILERALQFEEVKLNKDLIKKAIPYAEKLTKNQKLHFISDPGVFSYDAKREKRFATELNSPPQLHIPKLDSTNLPKEGLYVVLTGIQGLADSGLYNAAKDLGLQIYSGDETFNLKHNGVKHPPFKIANPKIKAQIARTGWSSVWSIHMLAEHNLETALLYPIYESKDDPEILMNNLGVRRLGLGVEINQQNPKDSLEKAIKLAQSNFLFNKELKQAYGKLDGIDYITETILQYQQNKDISKKFSSQRTSKQYFQ